MDIRITMIAVCALALAACTREAPPAPQTAAATAATAPTADEMASAILGVIAYMHSYPAWMMGVWAIGVWGGLLGILLLLLRRKWALPVFVASLAAYVLSLVYTYGLSDGASVVGGSQMYIMNAVILAGCVFFVWYSRLMAQRGVLR